MRGITFLTLWLFVLSSAALAQIAPHTATVATMDEPGENWFISTTRAGAYIYDGTTGEMRGLLSLSRHTPAVQPNPARKEFYAAESYYSRGTWGDRTDILSIYDYENLSPIGEVEIPQKITVLPLRTYIQLMGDGRHVGIFNMTPAASVTIVDVIDRELVGEISTPGCALIMAVGNNDFLMICGDGTMQLVQLDDNGNESNRERSREFFSVDDDPVFDRPVPFNGGWTLVSHRGLVYQVTVDGDDIDITRPWSMLSDADTADGWWPGGSEVYSVHEATGLMYILMHQGEFYTHHHAGSEVWIYDLRAQRRIGRITLESEAGNILVTQEAEPKLVVADEEGGLHVYDAMKLHLERTIADPGPKAELIQDL
ncbi:MAG: amine dehydrogenase large subunit [Woeseiaceae bacterium]|nr:amine dehydrogenase large subunit [Woeseiaceae bacterium]